jgi:glyoxylase-like metal-dependent hydrolase (beta-lactamase superfamily II)/8-oxo-dGTP pyrophosphatase MutT (NUDIX family)
VTPEGLYEQVLLASGAAGLPASRPPRASASIVLWRRAPELEVFWIERGRALPFMGGWHAFPGGAVERSDAALPVAGAPRGASASSISAPSPDPTDATTVPDLIPGLAAAALRELAEETGVFLLDRPVSGASRAYRRERTRLGEKTDWADALAALGASFDASRLEFAGRWLTPPFSPLRFDNRFFLCEWRPADGAVAAFPPENESGEWIAPAAALARIASGSVLVAPPIEHILRGLAESGPELGVARLVDTTSADWGPLRRIELRPGIAIFPLAAATLPPATHTNAFLLGHGDCVLVDPGSPFPEVNEKLLAALAAARQATGRRVVEIWLSHHHPDHVAGVEPLRRALGVPVAAHAATGERLAARGIAIDRRLAGGERLRLAGEPALELRLHATPGHARGHLAVEVLRPAPGGGAAASDLLVFDLVAAASTIVIDPPEGNMEDFLASLAAMAALAPRTLFMSHGGALLDGAAKLAEVRAHRLDRERQVLAAWNDGLRTPAEMLPLVYPDVPAMVHPLAERQIRAHLERLAALGSLGAPDG